MFLFIVQEIIYIVVSTYLEYSSTRSQADIGISLGRFYQVLAVFFFICLTWLASMMLDSLIDQLPANQVTANNDFGQQLRKWDHNFGLINDYIEEINRFFGLILLLALAKLVLNVDFRIFFIIQRQHEETVFLFLVDSLLGTPLNVIYLTLILLVSHRIQQKVTIVKYFQVPG